MKSTIVSADTIDRPIFELCTMPEERFLRHLMRHTPADLATRPSPEGAALLKAVEQITGGERGIALDPVPAGLVYQLRTYAHTADTFTPEQRAQHPYPEVSFTLSFLQSFMKAVAGALREDTFVQHHEEGIFIDSFEVPQWFYDEVIHGISPYRRRA